LFEREKLRFLGVEKIAPFLAFFEKLGFLFLEDRLGPLSPVA
jgi:hypothetical protein